MTELLDSDGIRDYEKFPMGVGRMPTRWNLKFDELARVISLVPPGAKVLEVGCGGGQFISVAADRYPDRRFLGCDLSSRAITAAVASDARTSFAMADVQRLPYADASIDMVIGLDIFEHLPDPHAALLEVARILKPGGRFYVFMPCEDTRWSIMRLLRRIPPTRDITRRHWGHLQYVTPAGFTDTILSTGLKVERVRYAEHLPSQFFHIFSIYLPKEILMRMRPAAVKVLSDNATPEERSSNRTLAVAKRLWEVLISTPVAWYSYHESRWLGRVSATACGIHVHAVKAARERPPDQIQVVHETDDALGIPSTRA